MELVLGGALDRAEHRITWSRFERSEASTRGRCARAGRSMSSNSAQSSVSRKSGVSPRSVSTMSSSSPRCWRIWSIVELAGERDDRGEDVVRRGEGGVGAVDRAELLRFFDHRGERRLEPRREALARVAEPALGLRRGTARSRPRRRPRRSRGCAALQGVDVTPMPSFATSPSPRRRASRSQGAAAAAAASVESRRSKPDSHRVCEVADRRNRGACHVAEAHRRDRCPHLLLRVVDLVELLFQLVLQPLRACDDRVEHLAPGRTRRAAASRRCRRRAARRR